MRIPASPAALPDTTGPAALPGWDPSWSRLVTVRTFDGDRTMHVLDTGAVLAEAGLTPRGTILAVHGNPTWSYLWRSLASATVEAARAGHGPAWRVVAPDQLDMGFSERLAHHRLPAPSAAGEAPLGDDAGYRTLGGRIADLDALVSALGLDAAARQGSALLTLGHDWGGVVSLGWAGRNQDLVSGAMTLNTAVHRDPDEPIPAPLRAALAGPLLPGSTVLTDAFLRVTTALGHPGLEPGVRAAYHLPYSSARRRGGIGGFVADIPVGPAHGSHEELQRVSTDLASFRRPALILWGPKDPVFLDRYLADLLERLPAADLHRFETAGHLIAEDVDIAAPVLRWARGVVDGGVVDGGVVDGGVVDGTVDAGPAPRARSADPSAPAAPADRPLWAFLDDWREQPATALVDLAGSSRPPVSWRRLAAVVDAMAVGLVKRGVRPGDRISMMVTPGLDLTAALYASLRVGAVVVVADAGLGIAGMTRAVRAARPDWVIGAGPGLTVARAQRWPGRRISVATLSAPLAAALGVEDSLYRMAAAHAGQRYADGAAGTVHEPAAHDAAAILYTSGSTGPAKGVLYTHGRLSALAGLLRDVFDVRPGSSLLAGFAPFALLGPAIGATSITPDMSVTRPATLTATAVAEAAEAGEATILFASPAALRNVAATAGRLSDHQRAVLRRIGLVLSAGAPVHPQLMARVAEIFPAAEIHSPYGMTEALLLADIDRHAIEELASEPGGAEDGVCVGRPVGPVRIAIAPLGPDGAAADGLLEGLEAAGVLGEVVVSAPHQKAGYDRLWLTDALSRRDERDGVQWHRTQDVGHLDGAGRLWIEGRLQHVVTTADGPVAPGGPEARVDALDAVQRSAMVGVGPDGTQAVVAVVQAVTGPDAERIAPGLAPTHLAAAVRAAAAPVPVAAVLVTDRVPVDIRHNSKIDRTRLARWAGGVLAGGRVGTP